MTDDPHPHITTSPPPPSPHTHHHVGDVPLVPLHGQGAGHGARPAHRPPALSSQPTKKKGGGKAARRGGKPTAWGARGAWGAAPGCASTPCAESAAHMAASGPGRAGHPDRGASRGCSGRRQLLGGATTGDNNWRGRVREKGGASAPLKAVPVPAGRGAVRAASPQRGHGAWRGAIGALSGPHCAALVRVAPSAIRVRHVLGARATWRGTCLAPPPCRGPSRAGMTPRAPTPRCEPPRPPSPSPRRAAIAPLCWAGDAPPPYCEINECAHSII